MENEHTIDLFALTPPYAPKMVELVPPDSVAHGGASIAHVNAVDGFSVILFAYVGQAENDRIRLYLNDEFAREVIIAKGKESENTTLTIPSERFHRGRNNIKFSVERLSQNEEFTRDLILLYRSSPPGDVPPVLAIKVSHESIGADEADDVSVTVTYKNAQWYDRIFVDCNGVVVRHQLVPDVEPPVSAVPQTVVIPIAREVLEQGGNDSDFTFKFRVVDNLTNPNGPPTWSDIVNADVHLDRITLAMPILREILTENNDDPAIVDLAKLNGGPLWALIHLIDTIWKVGDEIHLTFTALVNGSQVATHEQTLPITQVPGQFSWDIPNSKVIADSVVRVIYEQVRNGAVIATSRTATAQVTVVPELTVDTSPLYLSGRNISARGTSLAFTPTGRDPSGTAFQRRVSGGVPPYIFEVSDTNVASVDKDTGLVRSEGNGSTTVVVSDASGQRKMFPVDVSNVFFAVYNTQPLDKNQAQAWIDATGIAISAIDLPILQIKYTADIQYTLHAGTRSSPPGLGKLFHYRGTTWELYDFNTGTGYSICLKTSA
ncbi:hypothetical protein [Pseudomonas sp. Irchel s3h14]|uniref:hypothetical protein n=1 Tax=Pseudomonas sp. Irchel s3h14 TaxID=2009179 RepID=UPI000BA43749|nr:hypothetical protein [Pseudomonas sp. Irchel s3h14]